jgi:hypothetical protein
MTLPLFSQRGLAHAQSSGELAGESTDTTDFTINIVSGPVEIRISNLEDLVLEFEPTQGFSGPRGKSRPCVYATQPGTKYAIELSGTVLTDGRTEYQYTAEIADYSGSAESQFITLDRAAPNIPVYGTGYTPSYTEGCAGFDSFELEVRPRGDLTIETVGAAVATITITVRAL